MTRRAAPASKMSALMHEKPLTAKRYHISDAERVIYGAQRCQQVNITDAQFRLPKLLLVNSPLGQKSPFGRNSSHLLTMDDAICTILIAVVGWSKP